MFIKPFFEDLILQPSKTGELSGLSFGVKANIHVAGMKLSQGVKQWDDAHLERMTSHAECVTTLINAGGTFKGTFHTSAFAFDLSGQNTYGMPVNPRVPLGISGGSSSGSASAVAQGIVDFALGTDTGGSIRIPGAYCGVWSLRPTYGSISTNGVIPTGPDTDVVGIIAKNAKILMLAGRILLNADISCERPKLFYTIKEFFELCPSENLRHFENTINQIAANYAVKSISIDEILKEENIELKALKGLQDISRLLLLNTWETLIPWINEHMPNWENEKDKLTPEVHSNLLLARETAKEFSANPALKEKLRKRLDRYKESLINRLVQDEAIILMPTVPHGAPQVDQPLKPEEIFKMITLTCLSSLLGLPQLHMPLTVDSNNKPLGLSLVGIPQMDHKLLECGVDIENKIIASQ